ncbi:MAG TPA: hypothetical protein DD723_04840 [Candidatus Omnitrophica bacterium]|nr:hypothetical protein [Candidatus Omnitrophota bacterium]
MILDDFQFAKRTDWPLASNQLGHVLEQLRKENIPVIDLTESNPTQGGFVYPEQKILEALGDVKNLTYTPASEGLLKAREAVSRYYQEKSLDVPPERILLTSSTSEGYSYLFRLLANPGERILFPQPSYPLFQFLVDLNDIEMVNYPLYYAKGRWQMDFERLEEGIDINTKAIVIVNPNNPTGSFLRAEDIKVLNAICRKRRLALICDEVFGDYVLNNRENYISLAGNEEALTFVLSGISKTLGLPQMKLSWIVMSGPRDLVQAARERLEIISDTYLSVNTPVQHALSTWLPLRQEIQKDILNRVQQNYAFIQHLSEDSLYCRLLHIDGGWYGILRIPDWHSEEAWVLLFLREEHILVHPGYFFDFEEETYIVLSLLCPVDDFQKGIRRLFKRVERENLKNLKA